MAIQTLDLVDLDEGGVRQSKGNLRLVCLINRGGKLAIWGSGTTRQNIDTVYRAGMPCTVECDCIPPESWALQYGHTLWVPEDRHLRILKTKAIKKPIQAK